jgi:hypothetical protein
MKRVVILSAALALVGAIWLLLTISARPIRTPSIRTRFMIAAVLNDVDLWNDEDAKQYGPFPTNGMDSVSLNRAVAGLFKFCGDKDIQSGKLVGSDGLFRDAWGQPLVFISTNSPSYERINPELKGKARPFVIWSAGPNQTDEYGFGDDIVSHL